MFKQASRVVSSARVAPVSRPVTRAIAPRTLHTTSSLRRTEDEKDLPQEQGEHIGTHSRTDNRIAIPFDEETQPQQKPVQGRGAFRESLSGVSQVHHS